ncbi:hypothetical protein V5799_023337 [Amblyomma americanum]|uniref:Uncharacterized protein n=1 Tax=Amblyomma americanum TaxID=6943 RepID=A0AAQ4FI26_AMBAM
MISSQLRTPGFVSSDGRKQLKWNAVPTIAACDNRQKHAKRKVSRRPGSDQAHGTLATTEELAASTTFPSNVHGCEVRLPAPEIEAQPNETALPCTIEVVGYPRLSSPLAIEVEVETSALVPEKQFTDAWTMPDEPGSSVQSSSVHP